MKYLRHIILLLLPVVMLSCIKDLEKEGIYTTTTCHGVLLDNRTNQPVSGMRVILTNGDQMPEMVVSALDGTFNIDVEAKQVDKQYYLMIEADSLYESRMVSLQEIGYGQKIVDLGTIYIVGPEVPVVITRSVMDVTAASAKGFGEVVDEGKSHVTSRGLCWSTEQYPTTSDYTVISGSGLGSFEAEITSLSVGTTYYVRAFATNGVGTSYGDQVAITTLDGLPQVMTEPVSGVQPTSASCGGIVVDDGGFPVTARGVCWSTNINPAITNAHSTNGTGIGNYTGSLIGLQPNTTYYVRAYALNVNGVVYGEQRNFTTLSGLPVVTTANVTQVGNGMAVCGGTVQGDGGFAVTARGVCFSSTPNPTLASPHTSDGTGLGSFVSQLTGLAPGQTYYVRAYATNSAGTVYGNERTFVGE